jgi:hypothetical protein
MRVLVTGSRTWSERVVLEIAVLAEVLGVTPREVTLVHGACGEGADRIADAFARRRGWVTEPHPADWARHGTQAAGPVRNQRMVDLGADVCVAFVRDRSRGATGTVRMARKAGIRTVVWRHEADRVWLDPYGVEAEPAQQGALF